MGTSTQRRSFQLRAPSGEPVVAQINSSWTTRVRRDDLVTFHVDGTHGSAVAGLQDCRSQARVNTPKPVWNPDVRQSINFMDQWQLVPEYTVFDNGFKTQWEAYIRHVCEDAPFKWNLLEGAKGVQLAELGLPSALGRALAPLAMGLLWSAERGYTTGLWMLLVASIVAMAALLAAQHHARRATRHPH